MPTPISQYGEFGLIDHLTQNTQHYQRSTIKGIGDDSAVLNHEGKQTIITTDLLLEGIHFDLMYTPLKHLGYKAVVVNLSDIYAMNAIPQQITVSIGVSARFSVEALEALYDGIHAACKYYQVDLVGGDTSSSLTGLCISITAIGTAESHQIVYRNGAKVGDIVCVSGDLGAAFVGLQLLEREKKMYLENPNIQPDLEQQQYVVGRLLKPEARRDIVALLQSHQIQPTAMIDVSDGLSSELLHICHQSKVGCRIYEDQLPMHPDTQQLSFRFNMVPTTCALNGGEDYELLFTVSPQHIDVLEGLDTFSIIGDIVAHEEGCILISENNKPYPLVAQGWQHT